MATEDTLRIQQEITEAIRKRTGMLQQQTRILREQTDIASELKANLGDVVIPQQTSSRIQDITRSLEEAAAEATGFEDDLQKSLEEAAKSMADFDNSLEGTVSRLAQAAKETSTFKVAASAFGLSFLSTLTNIKSALVSATQLTFSFANAIFQVAKSVASIPIKIFNALVEEANNTQGGTQLRQAFEDIRKTFGDFKTDISKNVISAMRSMRGELANTGLSVYRTAGLMWERLNLVRELAEGMKATFHLFGQEIAANAEVMIAYQKGLGLTGEQFKGFAAHTTTMRRTLGETLKLVATFSTSLGKQFGISQKTIARDVGEMVQDLKTFGSVGIKEMAQLSVFARKLGVDFKDLQGIVDQFDNFEDAAENAAKLSQAFGLNIDVMKMMNEQDVGKRIDMMRQSFFQAGKSIKGMTRQERNYLAATTGVADAALDQVFAMNNQSKTYAEVTEAGSAAEKQQLTTEQAMQKLSASIERIVRQGQRSGGFLDRFILGLTQGVRWSKDFRRTIWTLKRDLWIAERAGRQVGRSFTKMFPGMANVMKGFREFFEPKKFQKMANSVVKGFRQFFTDLSDPATSKEAFGSLLKNFKNLFMTMVDDETSAVSKIVKGFKQVFKTLGQIALSAGKIVIENTTKFMNAVFDVFTGKNKSFGEALKKAFGGAKTEAGNLLDSILNAIKSQLGPASKKLFEITSTLFTAFTEAAKKRIIKFFADDVPEWIGENKKLALIMAGVLFGPSFIAASLASLVTLGAKWAASKALKGLGSTAGKVFGKSMGDNVSNAAADGLKPGGKMKTGMSAMKGFLGQGVKSAFTSGIGGAFAAAGAVVAAGVAGWNIGKALDKEFQIGRFFSGEGFKSDPARIVKQGSDESFEGKTASNYQHRIKSSKKSLKELMQIAATGSKEFATLASSEISVMRQALQTREDLTGRERQVLLNSIRLKAKIMKDAAVTSRLVRLEEEGDNTGAAIKAAIGQVNEIAAARHQALTSAEKEEIALRAGQTAAQLRMSIKSQEMLERIKSKVSFGKKSVDISDFKLYDKIKKINVKEIEASVEKFNNKIKPLLIGTDGKGGLRGSMVEIGQAFSGDEIARAGIAIQAVTDFAVITEGLNMSIKSMGKLSQNLDTVGRKIDKRFNNPKSIPVVAAIKKMVDMTNRINSDLSNLGTVNLKPKLENLGKALGFNGNDSLDINKRDFKIHVNVNVTIDSEELGKSLVDTGQVVAGPKNNVAGG